MVFYPPLPHLAPLFFLGLFGTGHCLGMCGPLAVAFPGRHGTLGAHLLYHLGRITTYTVLGALLGLIGGVGAPDQGALGQTVAIQIGFSVFAALFLLLFALTRLDIVREPAFMTRLSPHRIPGVSLAAASTRGVGAMFPLGLAMGLLPCGLSYAAFARAVPAGGPLAGGLFLLAFGLGTLPGLLVLGTAAGRLFLRHRKLLDVVAALIMVGMAVDLLADLAARLG